MIIYVILGITFTFLGLYATNYFQVIIDSFETNTTTISMITFYGIILLVTAIIGYIDNYPVRKLFNKLYLVLIALGSLLALIRLDTIK